MLLEDISTHLIENGAGGASSIFLGSIPDTPNDVVGLWEYGGSPPEHVKDQKLPVEELPRLQVITRSASYPTGRLKMEEIYQLLVGYEGVLNGVTYKSIRALQPPFYLDRDDKNRARFVCNFEVVKEVSPIG